MKRASSEARKSAAQATSQAVPMRPPSGTAASRCAISFSLAMPSACEMPSIAIGVSISPGMITFARMPYFALPIASVWV